MDQQMEEMFKEVGRDLFLSGAITSHGGNLSVSDGESIWITRTQSELGRLKDGDVIRTTWEPSELDSNCSSELIVHRALYHAMKRRCDANGEEFGSYAIVHAHTAHTTLRSLYYDEIESVDSECKLLLPNPVKVIHPSTSIGSPEAAQMLSDIVESGENIGIISGHGPFCINKTMSKALQLVTSLEHSCALSDLMDQKEAAAAAGVDAVENLHARKEAAAAGTDETADAADFEAAGNGADNDDGNAEDAADAAAAEASSAGYDSSSRRQPNPLEDIVNGFAKVASDTVAAMATQAAAIAKEARKIANGGIGVASAGAGSAADESDDAVYYEAEGVVYEAVDFDGNDDSADVDSEPEAADADAPEADSDGKISVDIATASTTPFKTRTPSYMKKPPVPSPDKIDREISCDVLVIGTCTAGIPAVLAAAEEGAEVIGIDKGKSYGWVPASQDFGVINSKIQQELGIKWAPKSDIVQALLRNMDYRPNPLKLNYWYDHSGETFDWMIEGANYSVLPSSIGEVPKGNFIRPKFFPPLEGYDYHNEEFPYFHGSLMTLPGAYWLLEHAAHKAEAAGAKFMFGMHGEQLITDDNGRVIGAYAHDDEGRYTRFNVRKGVVLTCGDFAGNKAMVADIAPHASQFENFFGRRDTKGNQSNTGDGHIMAMWAGAALDNGPFAPQTHHMGGPLGVDPFLLVNSKGKRFMNEDVPGQTFQNQLIGQPKGYAWQIVDDDWRTELEAMPAGHGYVNHYLTPEEADSMPWIFKTPFLGYTSDVYFKGEKPVPFYKPIDFEVNSIEEAAEKMEVPYETLKAEIDRYNELCDNGADVDFGKKASRMFPVRKPPFYITKFDKTGMLVINGGIKTDVETHALTAEDEVVPGLYMAGNDMGGIFSCEYPVTVAGLSMGSAITFGRLAGTNAARGI